MTRWYRVTRRNERTGERKTNVVATGRGPFDLLCGWEERDGWVIVYPVEEFDKAPPPSRAEQERIGRWLESVMRKKEPGYRWRFVWKGAPTPPRVIRTHLHPDDALQS